MRATLLTGWISRPFQEKRVVQRFPNLDGLRDLAVGIEILRVGFEDSPVGLSQQRLDDLICQWQVVFF